MYKELHQPSSFLLFFITVLIFTHAIFAQNANPPYELRINSGGSTIAYGTDIFEADSHFTGNGKSYVNNKISDISGTERDGIYLSERSTKKNLGNFGYAIPVENGDYTLNLHFAEIWFGATGSGPNGNGKRVFSVEIEGNTILSDYDINKEVGTMTAVIKTYEVTVTDGVFNLDFSASVNQPKLSALEILGEEQRPPTSEFVKRINSGGGELTFGQIVFEADNSFSGDQRTYTNRKISGIAGTDFDALYTSERSPGSNVAEFGYDIPLDAGDYLVKLHFAEIYFGATGGGPGGAGIRVFSVEMEGSDVLVDFDINAESGSMTAVVKSFNINVDDGQLNMRFYSSVNRAKLSGIEIFGEEQQPPVEPKMLARINSGGSALIVNGIAFESDNYHTGGGKPYANNNIGNIAQTDLDAIYKTERSTLQNTGSFGYAIPVTDGDYTIKLHFAEIYFGATGGGPNGDGKRVFDVVLEGKPVLSNFDINKEVGAMTATVKTFETSVTDGELNIGFSASFNQPKLSAIEIFGTGEIVNTPSPCQWSDLKDSSFERLESQSAKVDGKLYVMAGFGSGLKINGATEIYHPSTDSWSMGKSMPTPVTHMGIAVVDDEIWILAGFAGNHPGVATNKVQIYNTISDSWRNGPDLPHSRGSGTAAYNLGKVHFFGGLKPDRKTDVGEHFVINVNDINSGWQTAAPMPNPRNHLSAASIDGIVYAIGGQYGHDSGVDDQNFLHAYNPGTDTWSRKADLPTDRSHFEPGTAVHNDKIIIAGGRNQGHFFDNLLQYDPSNNTWSEICKLPNPLLAPVTKVFGNKLIVTNGGIEGTRFPQSKTRYIIVEPENVIQTSSKKSFSTVEIRSEVKIYPNPSSDKFYIDFLGNPQSSVLEITNLYGEIVEEFKFRETTTASFELGHPNGIYFLKIRFKSGQETTHKLIKL